MSHYFTWFCSGSFEFKEQTGFLRDWMRQTDDSSVMSGAMAGLAVLLANGGERPPVVVLYGAQPFAVFEARSWQGIRRDFKPTAGSFMRVALGGTGKETAQLTPSHREVSDTWIYSTTSGDSAGGLWVSGGKVRFAPSPVSINPESAKITRELKRSLGSLFPFRPKSPSLLASVSGEVGPLKQAWEANLDGKGSKELVIVANSRPDLGVEAHLQGDYCIALVKSGSRRTVLIKHVYSDKAKSDDDFGWSARIEAIADLNGDGTSEIVVIRSNFAGEIVTLFSTVGSQLKAVAELREGV